MVHRLPAEYRLRPDPEPFLDVPSGTIYQPDVYRLAEFVARRAGARYVVDVGCGAGVKLAAMTGKLELVCIDTPVALESVRRIVPNATLIPWDLENGLPRLEPSVLASAVVICADVLEHLRRPDCLARDLATIADRVLAILVSTPDRDRARGVHDFGPPANPAHVLEWSHGEFVRFLSDSGMRDTPFAGHTVNTDRHGVKATSLVVAGRLAMTPVAAPGFTVAAVINVYNERDILPEVVAHLHRNGVEAHIFDNWSTDGSFEIAVQMAASGMVRHVGRFPEVDPGEYDWAGLLQHTQEYAATLDADWVLHQDADELRSSPWPGIRLADAIAAVDRLGYDAIDFSVIDFRFLRVEPEPATPYEDSLNWFEFGRRPGHFRQIKGWRNTGAVVDLVSSGGHVVHFAGRRVFPYKFLMKHYPLRTREQAQRKIFRDRLPRITREQAQLGWHTQYESFRGQGRVLGWERHRLHPWHPWFFASEYLVERLSGVGLVNV